MPDPIQSVSTNRCEYEPPFEVNQAPPVATPPTADGSKPPPGANEPAVALLVSKHPPPQCVSEKAALLVASGALIRSAGAMVVAAPTVIGEIPAITAFIASSIAVAASTALYLNCEDDAKATSKAK